MERERKDILKKIIAIIIIIILLILFYLLGYRIGRIGYKETYKEISGKPTETMQTIKINGEDIENVKNKQIDIFTNEQFQGEKKIAPKSKGTYKFYIENVADQDITYNINFLDEMKNLVNMKYKLKIDNVYIRGNEDTYIDIESLNVEDIIVLKDSNNVFTLEWYWEDDDENDTYVGSQEEEQYYTLKLEIEASKYDK